MDMSARLQQFDLKTTYQFETISGIDQYNMPLYSVQTEPGGQNIASFPVYQGFLSPIFVNGIQVPFYTDENSFYNLWPDYIQSLVQVAVGDGMTTTFQFSLPFFPALPGHLDILGVNAYYGGQTIATDPIFANVFPVTGSSSNFYRYSHHEFLSWGLHNLHECQW